MNVWILDTERNILNNHVLNDLAIELFEPVIYVLGDFCFHVHMHQIVVVKRERMKVNGVSETISI